MKKLNFLAMGILALGLASCSDDDNKTATVDVVGNWEGVKFLVEEPYDLNGDGVAGNDYKEELPCLINDLDLHTDGTGLLKRNLRGWIDDETVGCVEYEEFPMEWKLNEDKTKVLLMVDDETIEVKIVNNTLELHLESLIDDEIGIPGKIVYVKK